MSQETYESLRDEYMPELPPLDGGEYLIAILFELGPVMPGPMGSGKITFGEIDSWCNRIGIDLTVFETRTLQRLSIEYLNESQRATDRYRAAPWLHDGEVAKPQLTAAQESLRALARDV